MYVHERTEFRTDSKPAPNDDFRNYSRSPDPPTTGRSQIGRAPPSRMVPLRRGWVRASAWLVEGGTEGGDAPGQGRTGGGKGREKQNTTGGPKFGLSIKPFAFSSLLFFSWVSSGAIS
jgi:hypothetical protein